jgi:hypothetical protein
VAVLSPIILPAFYPYRLLDIANRELVMVIESIELAAVRALPGDLVFLARVPEAFGIWVSVHQFVDFSGQTLAIA